MNISKLEYVRMQMNMAAVRVGTNNGLHARDLRDCVDMVLQLNGITVADEPDLKQREVSPLSIDEFFQLVAVVGIYSKRHELLDELKKRGLVI